MNELIDTLEKALEARRELQKCRDGCEYDAGYFCHREQERADRAESEFVVALKRLVDARVHAALGPND